MDQMTWTALAALVIGGIVRILKSDGTTIALANLHLPPIPKRALPWLALAFGAASAVLDARVNGVAWSQAAMVGVIAASAAVLGHDLGKSLPGVKRLLGVAVFATIASQTMACALLSPRTLRTVLDIAQTTCIIAHQELPESEVAKVCGVVDDLIPPMRQVLAESRKASAKAGAQKCGEQ